MMSFIVERIRLLPVFFIVALRENVASGACIVRVHRLYSGGFILLSSEETQCPPEKSPARTCATLRTSTRTGANGAPVTKSERSTIRVIFRAGIEFPLKIGRAHV